MNMMNMICFIVQLSLTDFDKMFMHGYHPQYYSILLFQKLMLISFFHKICSFLLLASFHGIQNVHSIIRFKHDGSIFNLLHFVDKYIYLCNKYLITNSFYFFKLITKKQVEQT